MPDLRDRIKSLRRVRAGDLVAHPGNFRRHPESQRSALSAVLERVGYAAALVGRELPDGRVGIVDGHLRATLDPDQKVPVLIVDIDEAEAEFLLATLDPLAAMAQADQQALRDLVSHFGDEEQAIIEAIGTLEENAPTGEPPKARACCRGDGDG